MQALRGQAAAQHRPRSGVARHAVVLCPAARPCLQARRSRTACAAAQAFAGYQELLEWAAGRANLKVAVRDLDNGSGRGLVAVEDIQPNEEIISVPLDRVFQSATSEMHWGAEMGFRLLQERHANSVQLGSSPWAAWLAALPEVAPRTPLEYTEEELDLLGCSYVAGEARVVQECVKSCYEELKPQLQAMGYGWSDFLWSVQVLHSRCFFESTLALHLCVPGVDMANHSLQPSAVVRIQHSPDDCQGLDATAEIAPPQPPQPSRFKLIAGEAGIRAGEEVTISYGRWPNDVFLLIFGFVPADNPYDTLLLFQDAAEALSWYADATGVELHDPEAALRSVEEALPSLEQPHQHTPDYNRIVVTREGVDARLAALLVAVHAAVAEADAARRPSGVAGIPKALEPARYRKMVALRLTQRLTGFVETLAKKPPSGDGGEGDDGHVFVGSKVELARRALSLWG